MTLDLLDQAFIERWQSATPVADPSRQAPVSRSAPTPEPPPIPGRGFEAASCDLVDRLLRAAGPEWSALADAIESARRRGLRAIAIASCEPGSGCTTIVSALSRTLHDRGHETVACEASDIHATGPTHDKKIVLVDAGVWFPPGRIHRHRLLVATAGCDAAILVRRGNRPAPAAWAVTLEALGIEPLGEVVSFAPPVGGMGDPGATP